MRSSLALVCIRSAAVAVPLAIVIACGSTGGGDGNGGFGGSSGSGGGTSGSGTSGNGGTSGVGGTGSATGAGTSGSGTTGSGATGSGATGTGTTGATTGATTGSGTTGTGVTGATGATTGSATGSTTGTAGTSSGVIVDAGPSSCGTPGPNVLSDFEQDTGILVQQGGRTGWWYVFADPLAGTQTPAASTGPIAVGAAPADAKTLAGETCNKFALLSTATGHTMYTGVGATFVPGTGTSKTPYNLTAYDGIQFDIKGVAGAQPLYFEMLTKETQPTTLGGSLATTANATVAINNNRGYYLSAAGSTPTNTSTSIPTATTTVYVPFSLLIPRHFPAPTGCGTDNCQAPAFTPTDALGFQFSAYPDMGNMNGSYNLAIDNVSLYTGDNGLTPSSPTAAAPAFNNGAVGFASCQSAIPTFAGTRTAAGKYLQWGYNNWKNRFVSGTPGSARKVIRPENGNDTVSEGIGYGMLLAVYFNDPTLFADLWTYETQNRTVGTLMTWNNTGGSGSATDADEDMAFALIEAGKKFGGTYAATAATMISDIATHDIDFTTNLPKGGSNYATVNPTNPSYFAPAYYRVFGGIDTGHAWASLANNTITVISNLATAVGNGHGLVPAWCLANCTTVGTNGAPTDGIYQYDAHRVPWRIGTDYCWNGTPSAKTYLATLSGFFNGVFANGVDSVYDLYNLNGGADTPAAQPNSMSIVGTAAVGAMSTGATDAAFVKAAWQFVLDGGNRATLDVSTTPAMSSYSYFNATVGLLTALTISGNFYQM